LYPDLGKLLGRSGVRDAAHNLGWLVVEKAMRFVFTVCVGFWVARYLGPARLGTLGYCTALVALIAFLPALGLDAVLKRELLQSPTRTGELMASSLGLRLGAATLAYALVLLAAFFGWGLTAEESWLFGILGLTLFQQAVLLPDLWLQVHLQAKWSVVVQLAALVIGSALRVWLILSGGSLAAFAWVAVVEMALGAAGICLVARRLGLRVPRAAARIATMGRLLAESWPLLFASLAIIVYMKIDQVMLRQLGGPVAVGIYAAAAKISEIWYFLPVALASSVLPALLRARAGDASKYDLRLQQYYDLSAGAAYALSIPTALAAPWLVRLAYGVEFVAAGPILAVHIWSSIFVFLGVARGQWLVNERLLRFYLGATIAGAVSNIVLNLLFIPHWGGLGAAWATVISYALAGWGSSFFHPVVRPMGAMQTRALLLPLLGWRYLRDR
jgi:O-antigen/teichoic acid export membrane protein